MEQSQQSQAKEAQIAKFEEAISGLMGQSAMVKQAVLAPRVHQAVMDFVADLDALAVEMEAFPDFSESPEPPNPNPAQSELAKAPISAPLVVSGGKTAPEPIPATAPAGKASKETQPKTSSKTTGGKKPRR